MMPSAICMQCSQGGDTVEFPSMREMLAHQAGGHVTRPIKVLPPSPIKGPSATELKEVAEKVKTEPVKKEKPAIVKPLELQYKWVGLHSSCNTEPKTVTIDLGEKWMIVAFCLSCDMQVQQLEVFPLGKITEEKKSKKRAND